MTMKRHTVELTDTEDKALAFAAVSQDEWITNVVRSRCSVAIDEIARITVEKCLEAQQPIPNSKDLMVELAFTNGWVKTAAQRQADYEAQAAARLLADQQAIDARNGQA